MGQINQLRAETISAIDTYTRLSSDFIKVLFLKASPTLLSLYRHPIRHQIRLYSRYSLPVYYPSLAPSYRGHGTLKFVLVMLGSIRALSISRQSKDLTRELR